MFVVICQIKLININIEFEVIWQKLQDLNKFPQIETYLARFCEERLVSFLEISVSKFFRHILLIFFQQDLNISQKLLMKCTHK